MTPLFSMHTELLRLRCAVATANFELKAKQLHRTIQAKFNLDQPRVPEGSPGGGQWTNGGDSESLQERPLATFAAARRRGNSEAFCETQFKLDTLHCNSVIPTWRAAVCHRQAMERYANCLSGRQIPPLSY
jgi:hypothetical protein